jgi:hypothetical protein
VVCDVARFQHSSQVFEAVFVELMGSGSATAGELHERKHRLSPHGQKHCLGFLGQ